MRGRELTFTAPFESQSMRWFQSLIRDTSIGGFKPLRYVVPFIGTPTNLLKWAGRRTPLGIFARSYRRAIREGGAAADLARARIVTGTGIMAGAYELWRNGNITGAGPEDWNEQQLLRRQGWQPYSIRVGDQWVSYRRFDPFAILLGQTTDFLEIMDQADFEDQSLWDNVFEVGGGLVGGASSAVQDKTWFRGITEFVELASDPRRYGPRYLQNIGLGFIPNVSAQVGRQMDPLLRETDTIMERILERIPSQRTRLALRRDLWGRPIESRNVLRVSPVDVSDIEPNPIDQELQRLNMAPSTPYHGYYPQFTSEQFSEYSRIRGAHAYEQLSELMSSPEYEMLSDEGKRDAVASTLRSASRFAREELVEQTPELLEARRQEDIAEWQARGAGQGLAAILVESGIGPSNMTVGNLPTEWNITLNDAQEQRHQQIWTELMEQGLEQARTEFESLTPEQRVTFLRELGAGVRDMADEQMRRELGIATEPTPSPMPTEPVAQAPQAVTDEVQATPAPTTPPVTETPPVTPPEPSTARPAFGDAVDFMGQTAQFYDVDLSTPVMQADMQGLVDTGASEFLAVSLTAMDYSPRYHTRSSPDLTPEQEPIAERTFYEQYSRLVEENRAELSNMTPEQQRRLMSSLASTARDATYAILQSGR
jgi:hypothetical protein